LTFKITETLIYYVYKYVIHLKESVKIYKRDM